MDKTPLSDELIELILIVLNKKRVSEKRKIILNIRKSEKPGEIIYVMPEMNVSCLVLEDKLFFYFEWPLSHRCHKAKKSEFLSELASKLPL